MTELGRLLVCAQVGGTIKYRIWTGAVKADRSEAIAETASFKV